MAPPGITMTEKPTVDMEEIMLGQPSQADSSATSLPAMPAHRAGFSGISSPVEDKHNVRYSPHSSYAPKSPSSEKPYSTAYSGMFSSLDKPKQMGDANTSLAQDLYSYANSGLSTASQWFKASAEPQKHLKLKRTAYLDGLRGFGALLVYILHNESWAHSSTTERTVTMEHVWGYNNHYHLATFPIVRVFFTGGHLAVSVFFVISGYVLSAKPLSLIHSKETVNLADNLGSAMFRRWLRLFIPVMISTFLWASSWHAFGIRSSGPMGPERTYFDEIWKWYCDFKNYSFIFNENYFNAYSYHAWSIPLEFRGSIVIYTTLIAVARCSTMNRLRIQCALLYYFMYIVDGWYCALFVMGMLLCDMDLLAARRQLPPVFQYIQNRPKWVYYMLLLVGLYIGGVPSICADVKELRNQIGWYYLSFLKPQAALNFAWHFRFWAASLVMLSVPKLKWLQSFFETPFCQYLGKISFGFYLIHGPLLWSIGDRVYAAVGLTQEAQHATIPQWINRFPFPNWGIFGLELNFLAAQLILFPLTLWLAELFTRFVDDPSVKFTQWLFKSQTSEERDFLV